MTSIHPGGSKTAASRRRLVALLLLVALFSSATIIRWMPGTQAAGGTSVSLTASGTAATENFNTLASSGTSSVVPTGWAFNETGTSANTTYTAGTGSSNSGDTYSFGAASNSERAFGTLQSGSNIPTIGACFTNNTGAAITGLTISYTGEQWRLGTAGRADRLDFQYSTNATSLTTGTYTDVDALDFSSPTTTGAVGALDGNAAANRTVITSTISGLNLPNGATFFIRWNDFNASGADDGLAVDDFSLTPAGSGGGGGPTNPSGVGAANPASVAAGSTTLLTVAVTPGTNPASTGLSVSGNLTAIGGSATQPFFNDGTNGDATAGDNTFSYNATVTTSTTSGAKTIPISITDAQARSGSASISLTVTGGAVITTPIHDIQGSGSSSPLVGQSVTTTGIVTGLRSNGFFVQAPDANADSNPNTSEGVLVFTSSAPPAAAAIGNLVSVTATVTEFRPTTDLNSPPETELTTATVSLISTGNALPAAVALTAADTSPTGSIEQLEKYEGMRVSIASLTATSPTQGTINEANATSTSNGVFYAVITGIARPFREPGIEVPDPVPSPAPPNVPRFDANPERLRVDSDGQIGAVRLELTSGALVTNVVGVLDYAFRTYTILPDAATPPTLTGVIGAIPVPVALASEFTVGSFNLERFYDTTDDPGGDVVLTTTAFNNRLNKASLAIRNVMRAPDIIGVEEMENLTTLQTLANKVNNDAVAAGGTNPQYQAYLVEGNDVGGIDVGFLVKTARVSVGTVTQFGKDTMYTEPGGASAILNDRPPLVLEASIGALPITVIVNHLRSLNGVDDPVDGPRVRAKRRAQAEYLANLIQSRQTANPNENLISVGDYNAFQFNDGLVDSIGTIKGTPTPPDQVVLASGDLVNPDLTDLVDLLPADQRYSFTFDGNAQTLDHELVNSRLLTRFTRLAFARNNGDYPESFRNDPNRPERISDHDMPVAYFTLGTPAQPGQVLISEFRFRGLGNSPAANAAANDEFIELYNNTNSDIFVGTADGSTGWALVAADGTPRFIVPNGTTIPARGHYLATNRVGYSLGQYAAGDGTFAVGDITYTGDIPDGSGIALFSSAAVLTLANRIDAAGYSTVDQLYREGTGIPFNAVNAEINSNLDYCFVRDARSGLPKDTNDNAADFLSLDPTAAQTALGARLGAPGPENLLSPVQNNAQVKARSVDSTVSAALSPNRVRDTTPDAANNSTFGTISIRRRFVNTTGAPVTRLRFRVVDVTTLPAPSGTADLRARTSPNVVVTTNDLGTCQAAGAGAAPCNVTVFGTTLEQPPSQPNGGGFNSSLSAGVITLGSPLGIGASVNVHFLLGVQQNGSFRFFVNVEALP